MQNAIKENVEIPSKGTWNFWEIFISITEYLRIKDKNEIYYHFQT